VQPLPEPLTEREEEVLQLLATALTNRQIAEELVISPATVKKHTGNICGKLGVGSHTKAAVRTWESGLLGEYVAKACKDTPVRYPVWGMTSLSASCMLGLDEMKSRRKELFNDYSRTRTNPHRLGQAGGGL
jgi:DNA-binding CsgD family transcriptional regulator